MPKFQPPRIPLEIVCSCNSERDIFCITEVLTNSALQQQGQLGTVSFTPANRKQVLLTLRQKLTQNQVPGLMIIDIDTPTSLDLIHDLRVNPALLTIPIIILTESLDESHLKTAFNHGVRGFMLKPVDRRQLIQLVQVVSEEYWLLSYPPGAN